MPYSFEPLEDVGIPDDLVDAVVARVRARLIDVDAPSLTWFGPGEAPDRQPLPYATISEPDEDDTYWNTQGDGLADGHLEISVFAGDKKSARWTGHLIKEALNDAPLLFSAGTLVYLRQSGRTAGLDPDPAPGGGDCWSEIRQFHFMYSSN